MKNERVAIWQLSYMRLAIMRVKERVTFCTADNELGLVAQAQSWRRQWQAC